MSDQNTLEPVAARPELNPAVAELAAVLAASAPAIKATAADADTAGHARRIGKLSRQVAAASSLLGRGYGLDQPPVMKSLSWLASGAERSRGLGAVDVDTAAMSRYLRALHEWRGHTGSLPRKDGA